MATTDFSGCTTSLAPAVLEDWNAMIRGFLAHAAVTPDHLGKVLAADPGFAQAHAAKGLFCLLLGRRELVETARECLAAARAAEAQGSPTDRERVYVTALADYLDGQPSRAATRFETLLIAHPRDALAMKLVQAIRFVLGQPRAMRTSLEALLPVWGDHPALGYLKGCHAFALEETGEYAAAETAGREGLLRAPDDAWGLHAVAHVYDMTARADEGLFWLADQTQAWAHCNNFRYHVWWHIALMHLDRGDYGAALDLYDTEIRADQTDDYRDISNAASLLSRLEVEGATVGNRWEELAALSENRTEDGALVFADLHYLLSLIGGGRAEATSRLLHRMASDAARAQTESDLLMEHPGLCAAHGLEAYGEGHFAEAFVNLHAGHSAMQTIGGSHAQRDVFERLTIEAGIRAGFLDRAETMISQRTARRGGAEDGYSARRMASIAAARQSIAAAAAPARA